MTGQYFAHTTPGVGGLGQVWRVFRVARQTHRRQPLFSRRLNMIVCRQSHLLSLTSQLLVYQPGNHGYNQHAAALQLHVCLQELGTAVCCAVSAWPLCCPLLPASNGDLAFILIHY